MLVPLLILAGVLIYCLITMMNMKNEYFALIHELDNGNILWYREGIPVQPLQLQCYGSDPLQRALCRQLRMRAGPYAPQYPVGMAPSMGRY